ncbi:MAG: redoxin domain-containing protein [Acidobacteria bacterium]|nr:redoxin domain-containing protein [Acidobacteriota bacterium]
MRKVAILAGVIVILAAAAAIGWRVYSGPGAPAAQVSVGQAVSDLTLTDLDAKPQTLASLKGEKGTLLIFIATRCPYSNAYNQRMEALHRDYSARGIRLVGINPNRTEPADEVRRHAQENGLTFTILKDDGNRVADYFGASVTPEAYLLDASNVLRYHGRLDSSHTEPSLNAHELRAALDALLSGGEIVAGKKAFGCAIKRVG